MNQAAAAVISLSKWLDQVGVTPCTAWRWRKKGWLKTVNIAGRQYLTQEAIDEFHRCAAPVIFPKPPKSRRGLRRPVRHGPPFRYVLLRKTAETREHPGA